MRPSFHPRLINGPFDDPGLFIPFPYQNRALVCDLGDIHQLPAREALKISHAFISHTHMDHFSGFDRLLRLFLGREKDLYVYGPGGFLENLEGKLSGYTWNLVENYADRFSIHATEVRSDRMLFREYRCRDSFVPARPAEELPFTGVLLTEPALKVSTVILDHKIDCLGFCIEERFHINILKEELVKMGLSIGPWLQEFKAALYGGISSDAQFTIPAETDGEAEKHFPLGELSERITRITPGQKIVYLTDLAGSADNMKKAIGIADKADHLFIEASFLDADKSAAAEKYHLTAREAGSIAGFAGVKEYTLFHISPRYSGMANCLLKEAEEAFMACNTP